MRNRLLVGLLLATVLAWACKSSSSSTPTVTGIVVAGNGAFTQRNATSQLTATANLSGGGTQDVSSSATWSSSNSSVATVSSTGLVTAVGNGTSSVSAAYQGSTGSLAVLVTLRATPSFTAVFQRLCGPFRAKIDVTIAETGGSVGFDITALTIRFRDLAGNVKVTKTYTMPELATLLGGSVHLNASQSKILSFESGYTPVEDTMDSSASIDGSVTDDVGNVIPVSVSPISQRDRC